MVDLNEEPRDSVVVQVASSVDDLDAALAWVVQRVERHRLLEPVITIQPFRPGNVPVEPGELPPVRFQVAISGHPDESGATP